MKDPLFKVASNNASIFSITWDDVEQMIKSSKCKMPKLAKDPVVKTEYDMNIIVQARGQAMAPSGRIFETLITDKSNYIPGEIIEIGDLQFRIERIKYSACHLCLGGSLNQIPCPDCDGTRKIKCPKCGGLGKITCHYCGGSGTLSSNKCPRCGGLGKVNEGELKIKQKWIYDYRYGTTWYIKSTKNTLHMETCPTCKGNTIVEGKTCEECNSGKPNTKRGFELFCEECGQTGRKDWCPKCDGQGVLKECPLCHGRKYGQILTLSLLQLTGGYFTLKTESYLSKVEDGYPPAVHIETKSSTGSLPVPEEKIDEIISQFESGNIVAKKILNLEDFSYPLKPHECEGMGGEEEADKLDIGRFYLDAEKFYSSCNKSEILKKKAAFYSENIPKFINGSLDFIVHAFTKFIIRTKEGVLNALVIVQGTGKILGFLYDNELKPDTDLYVVRQLKEFNEKKKFFQELDVQTVVDHNNLVKRIFDGEALTPLENYIIDAFGYMQSIYWQTLPSYKLDIVMKDYHAKWNIANRNTIPRNYAAFLVVVKMLAKMRSFYRITPEKITQDFGIAKPEVIEYFVQLFKDPYDRFEFLSNIILSDELFRTKNELNRWKILFKPCSFYDLMLKTKINLEHAIALNKAWKSMGESSLPDS